MEILEEENLAQKLIVTYENLFDAQKQKEQALVTREIDKLGSIDEKIVTFYNQALEISKNRELVKPSEQEVKKINELYLKIAQIEQSNQKLVEYSLNLINKIFTGIMKMAVTSTTEYDKNGKSNNGEDYGLSSISEEA